jgi:WD40 repeat protein
VNVFDIARNQSFDVEIHGYVDWLSVDRLGRYVGVVVHSESASRLYPTRVTVNVIDVRRRALMPHTFGFDARTAYAAEFTWDGQALVTAAQDRIDLWDLATGEKRSPDLYEAAEGVPTIGVHPNGRLAALGEDGGAIEVIDLATGDLEATLDPLASERFGVGPLFSPDGRWLAASYNSGRVVVWDTRSWQVHSVLEVDGSLVFAPDSRILFADGAIWSVEGASLGAIPDVDSSVGISDDGSTVVTFTEGTGVRKWIIAPERLLEHACMVAGRNLTQQEWDDVLPDRPYEHTCPQYPTGSRDSPAAATRWPSRNSAGSWRRIPNRLPRWRPEPTTPPSRPGMRSSTTVEPSVPDGEGPEAGQGPWLDPSTITDRRP